MGKTLLAVKWLSDDPSYVDTDIKINLLQLDAFEYHDVASDSYSGRRRIFQLADAEAAMKALEQTTIYAHALQSGDVRAELKSINETVREIILALKGQEWMDNHVHSIESRPKSLESFFNKMYQQIKQIRAGAREEQPYSQLVTDRRGTRILFKDLPPGEEVKVIGEIYDAIKRDRAFLFDSKDPLADENYIANPKPSGYKAWHVLLGRRVQDNPNDPLNVEIQATTLVWHTANEANRPLFKEPFELKKEDSIVRAGVLKLAAFAEKTSIRIGGFALFAPDGSIVYTKPGTPITKHMLINNATRWAAALYNPALKDANNDNALRTEEDFYAHANSVKTLLHRQIGYWVDQIDMWQSGMITEEALLMRLNKITPHPEDQKAVYNLTYDANVPISNNTVRSYVSRPYNTHPPSYPNAPLPDSDKLDKNDFGGSVGGFNRR